MIRYLLAAALTVAVAGVASNAFAFSVSVDVPTQYTLDSRMVNTDKSGPAFADHQTLTDVSGFSVAIAGSHHIGVGYEMLELTTKGNSGGGPFKLTSNLQFYNVLLDLPASWMNFGLGYGMGMVNTSIQVSGSSPPKAKAADANQWFASVGIPLSEHFDVHVAYHVVTAQDQKLSNTGGGSDNVNLSGHTLTAGIRLGW